MGKKQGKTAVVQGTISACDQTMTSLCSHVKVWGIVRCSEDLVEKRIALYLAIRGKTVRRTWWPRHARKRIFQLRFARRGGSKLLR
jgi:hypothetical protein